MANNLLLQMIALLLLYKTQLSFSSSLCIKAEREALLDLKSGLRDPSGLLSSWLGSDCCSWAGVTCDNRTGHITQLDLHSSPYSNDTTKLTGMLTSALVLLEELQYLDLSQNDFLGGPLPQFFGSIRYLRCLKLSGMGFSGAIPHQLGNLSSLQYLDLSSNNFDDGMRALGRLPSLRFLDLSSNNFDSSIPDCLFNVTSLEHLDLSTNNFNSTPDLFSKMSRLKHLDLSSNGFNSSLPESLFSSTSLEHLDLSENSFQGLISASVGRLISLDFLDISGNTHLKGPIPLELGNLCNLKYLDLSSSGLGVWLHELDQFFSGCIRNSLEHLDFSYSQLTGFLPYSLGGIKNLKLLSLSGNSITGSLPESIGQLSLLETLDISSNQLNGTIAKSFGRLSRLVSLDLSGNSMDGVVPQSHLANLTQLQKLDLSSNSLVLNISSNWLPPFQLERLALSSCKLGPQFPRWLRTQDKLTYIDLAHAGINDAIPDWFWSIIPPLDYLDLSYNEISGRLPDPLVLGQISHLDLSNNQLSGRLPESIKSNGEGGGFLRVYLSSNSFGGQIPRFPPNVEELDLSNNSFSGQIPADISETMPSMLMLSLSMNKLIGGIPSSLCRFKKLMYLDVSSNHLSGEVPDCWDQSPEVLQGLDFSNNNLSGVIPLSICSSPSLRTLHFRNTGLTGELHSSLKSCINLITLDLSFNRLIGKIPAWMGDNLRSLKILNLQSNMLSGDIPPQLSQLAYLQILELSHNNLSGTIPKTFGNFSAMKDTLISTAPMIPSFINFDDHMILSINGMDLQYAGLLSISKLLDLSDNNLSGSMPAELADLVGLMSLNLSGNHLTGKITEEIGRLKRLISLDLSRNQFSGDIPPSLADLTSLSRLNLSYNSLSGEIPSGNQLQTLTDPSIYAGNLDLCGFPLSRKCGSDDERIAPINYSAHLEDEVENKIDWTLVGVAPGFVVGISGVMWALLFQKRRRDKYFKLVDSVYDRIPNVMFKINSNNEI